MDWKTIVLIVALFAVCLSLSFVFGRCSAPKSAYSEAPMPDPRIDPPEPVQIIKYRKIVQQDSTWREKYDSLLASFAGNIDTTAKYLAKPWREEHRWRIIRDGFLAAGDLHLGVDPVGKDVRPTQTLDTLQLPPPGVRTETVETISIPWLIGAVAVGAAAGVWAGSR